MEYKVMNGANISNINDTAAYVVYMIMGSYFKKAVCTSSIKERQLKVVYSETKRDNQMNLEERCINYIDSKIVPYVPEEIFEDMVEVHFVPNKKENRLDVVFIGFDWKLTMWGVQQGNIVLFNYDFKEADNKEE